MSKMNEFDEEILEETEEVPFNDKRRFSEDGERIEVKVQEGPVDTAGDNPDENAGEGPEEEVKSPEVVKLENMLKELSIRCEAAETKLQGVQKRFEEERENLEKETAERRERMKKSLEQKAEQGRFNFLTELLPVLDNLNLAIDASEKDSSFENLLGGVKGTARSFERALINVGVEPIESVGELFNPELHEAVDMTETDESDEGKILAEYSKGYTFKGKLLRAARVQVGMATQKKEAGE